MRVVFPGGQHAPVELGEGVTHIGCSSECEIVLDVPGIAPKHCALSVASGVASALPLDPAEPTILNGRQITVEVAIQPGDLLVLGLVGCSILRSEHLGARAQADHLPDDGGHTRVRPVLPRFVLRGVSGSTFGKTFAVIDNAVIGRQPDSDIAVPEAEISRRHALLRFKGEGVLVEDLGSANGTFINDRRVSSGLLKPGDELRLDTMRFILATPGTDALRQSRRPPGPSRAADPNQIPVTRTSPAPLVILTLITLAAVAFLVLREYGIL